MKAKKIIIITLVVIVVLGIVLVPVQINYCKKLREDKMWEDFINLGQIEVITYLNINEDPAFVNTATEDRLMVVPEKYYPAKESALGYGRACVYVTVDGDMVACFGSLTYTEEYYADKLGVKPRGPFGQKNN